MYISVSSNFSLHSFQWKNIVRKRQCAKIDGG